MTIKELLKETATEGVKVPLSLTNMEITNEKDFCRYATSTYLRSFDFKEDLIVILDTIVLSSLKPENFSLVFYKDSFADVHLKVVEKK